MVGSFKEVNLLLRTSFEKFSYKEFSTIQIKFKEFDNIGLTDITQEKEPTKKAVFLSYYRGYLYVKDIQKEKNSMILKFSNMILKKVDISNNVSGAVIIDNNGHKKIEFQTKNAEILKKLISYLSQYNIQLDYSINFEYIHDLGSGGYSDVILVRKIKTKKLYATKIIDFVGKENKPLFPYQVCQEINAMRDVKCLNTPDLYEIFQKDTKIIQIMEYIKGSTLRNVIKKAKISKKTAFCILWSQTQTIYRFYTKGYVHRDIKPLNIIVKDFDSENPNLWKFDHNNLADFKKIFLIDFGLAIKDGSEKCNELKAKICGTAGYMPPELQNTRSEIGRIKLSYDKFDTFSLGLIVYELLTGVNPFLKSNSKETIQKNRKCQIDFKHKIFTKLTVEEFSLLKSLCEANPDKRCSIEDLITDPVMTMFDELQYNDNSNISSLMEQNKIISETNKKKVTNLKELTDSTKVVTDKKISSNSFSQKLSNVKNKSAKFSYNYESKTKHKSMEIPALQYFPNLHINKKVDRDNSNCSSLNSVYSSNIGFDPYSSYHRSIVSNQLSFSNNFNTELSGLAIQGSTPKNKKSNTVIPTIRSRSDLARDVSPVSKSSLISNKLHLQVNNSISNITRFNSMSNNKIEATEFNIEVKKQTTFYNDHKMKNNKFTNRFKINNSQNIVKNDNEKYSKQAVSNIQEHSSTMTNSKKDRDRSRIRLQNYKCKNQPFSNEKEFSSEDENVNNNENYSVNKLPAESFKHIIPEESAISESKVMSISIINKKDDQLESDRMSIPDELSARIRIDNPNKIPMFLVNQYGLFGRR